MKLTSVCIHDFLGIGYVSLDLADRGVVLIEGENQDDPSASSNGSGKSSLIDAIPWVLYGTSPRGGIADDVIRSGSKMATVKIFFVVDDVGYCVARGRTKGKSTLQLFKASADISAGTAVETQKQIVRLIGCSEEVFFSAIIAAQDRMPNLPGMTDKELKVIVEEAAGLSKIQDAYTIANLRLREAANALTVSRGNLAVQEATSRTLVGTRDSTVKDSDAWLEARDARIDARMSAVDAIKTDLEAMQAKITRLASAVSSVRTKQIDLAARLKSHMEIVNAHGKLKVAALTAQAQLKAFNSHVADSTAHVLRCEAALASIGTGETTKCDECGSVFTEDHRAHASAAAQRKLEAARESALLASQEATRRHGVLKAAVTALEASEAPGDPSEMMGENERLITVIRSFDRQLTDRDEQIRRVGVAEEELKRAETEPNPFTKPIAGLQTQIAVASHDLEALRVQNAAREQAVETQTLVTQVFSPAGVRAQILDQVTPFLNERTANYLTSLSDGSLGAKWTTLARTAKGELREKFSIEVTAVSGAISYAGLSGGEKRKVRLSCALALQDLVATRSDRPINLWVGDEIDDALDDSGLERLMDVLRGKAAERGTVLVVSHNDLKHWIPESIRVVRKDGKASVTEV